MLSTTVMKEHPPRFNMVGQKLPTKLYTVDEKISQGLAERLHRYALKECDEAGFLELCRTWAVEVYTVDGNLPPAERIYCVRFQNVKGGYIELTGIHTNRGWPFLNYGFAIGTDGP